MQYVFFVFFFNVCLDVFKLDQKKHPCFFPHVPFVDVVSECQFPGA